MRSLPLQRFLDEARGVDLARVADTYRMSRDHLAETLGLPRSTVMKAARSSSAKAQSRATEMVEILHRVREWAGGDAQAMAWYRAQPIPALDGRTAEALVKSGRAAWVRDYLDHLSVGGYA